MERTLLLAARTNESKSAGCSDESDTESETESGASCAGSGTTCTEAGGAVRLSSAKPENTAAQAVHRVMIGVHMVRVGVLWLCSVQNKRVDKKKGGWGGSRAWVGAGRGRRWLGGGRNSHRARDAATQCGQHMYA